VTEASQSFTFFLNSTHALPPPSCASALQLTYDTDNAHLLGHINMLSTWEVGRTCAQVSVGRSPQAPALDPAYRIHSPPTRPISAYRRLMMALPAQSDLATALFDAGHA
jgi:aminopeptidase N